MHFKNLVDCNGGGKTTMIFDVLREPMTPHFFVLSEVTSINFSVVFGKTGIKLNFVRNLIKPGHDRESILRATSALGGTLPEIY